MSETITKRQDNIYELGDYVISRYYGLTPAGNPCRGNWAIHNKKTGEFIEWSKYQNDMIEYLDIMVKKKESKNEL